MRRLPVLQKSSLVLGSPCDEPFLAMPLMGRGRHCDTCSRTVVDMTRMTRGEAEALFDAENESLCGYVLANDEGETFFAERETGTQRFPGMLATGLAAALLVSGCGASEHGATATTASQPTHARSALMPTSAKQDGPETEVLETVAAETEPCEAEVPIEAEPTTDADAGPPPRPRPVPRPGGIHRRRAPQGF